MIRSSMTPYPAIIEGKRRKVIGFDKDGNLVLAGGRLYELAPLARNAEMLCRPLLEVARLRRENGVWIWNESENGFSKWLRVRSLVKLDDTTSEDATFLFLAHALKKLESDVQAQVNGVAWFKCDDGAGGWNTPILLKVFRAVAETGQVAARPPKRARKEGPHEHKPMASGRQSGFTPVGNRFAYMDGFKIVSVDGEHFDLQTRPKARYCLEYLVKHKAFTEQTARHLDNEIDPYVRKMSGRAGLTTTSQVYIHHYFSSKNGEFRKLQRLVKPEGRTGRFYLKVS